MYRRLISAVMFWKMQRQIDANVGKLLQHEWLVFNWFQALELLRKFNYLKGERPVFSIYCERGLGLGPTCYAHFVPTGCNFDYEKQLVFVQGTVGGNRYTLTWSPDSHHDESGTRISYMTVLPDYFPREEFAKIEVSELPFKPGGAILSLVSRLEREWRSFWTWLYAPVPAH